MEKITIETIINQINDIAQDLQHSKLAKQNESVRETALALLQSTELFKKATTNDAKKDAALRVGESYLLFSSSLPDAGDSEATTNWGAANRISKLLGGPDLWVERVNALYESRY